MDSKERNERKKEGRSERGEKLPEHSEDEENKKAGAVNFNLAEKYDPSDDSEFEPDPDEINDQTWEEDDDDENDDDLDDEDR